MPEISALNDKIYDINWFMSNPDWTSKESVEFVIANESFKIQGSMKYNRDAGGSFESLEQQTSNITTKVTEFTMRLVNSIFKVNQYRNYNPYIVVGGEYVIAEQIREKLNVMVLWVLQQDITKKGIIGIQAPR